MIALILSNWRLLALLAGGLAAFGSGFYARGVLCENQQNRAEQRHERILEEARTQEQIACQKRQQITEETDYALQTEIDAIRARHAALVRRVRSDAATECLSVSYAARFGDEAAEGAELSGEAGSTAVSLFDLAAIADEQTQQLIACQDFIRKERE